jgi:hypothetical protein
MPDNEGQAGEQFPAQPGDSRPVPRSGARQIRPRLTRPDQQQRHRRYPVRDRVSNHHPGSEQAEQRAAEPWSGHLRERLRRTELAVAVMQPLPVDQRRHVALVRHVEEDGRQPGQQRDRVQLDHRQHAERGGGDHGAEDQHPGHVADDHQAAPGDPVDHETGRQRHQQEAGRSRRGQQADLEGRRVQQDDRGQRQRDDGDGRPDLADRLAGPEHHEVPVPPEAAAGARTPGGLVIGGHLSILASGTQPRRANSPTADEPGQGGGRAMRTNWPRGRLPQSARNSWS